MTKSFGVVNGSSYIKKVIINTNIIGKGFAKDCVALESVIIPNANTISDYAFCNCKILPSFDLPKDLTTISNYAFAYCDVLSITLPQTKLTIGDYAFAYCFKINIESLPASWTPGKYSFIGCTSIKTIKVSADISQCQGLFQGCTSMTDLTISTSSVPDFCFACCSSLKSVTITQSVERFGERSFAKTGPIEHVDLSNVGTYKYAFENSELKSVTFGKFKNMDFAFCGCKNLEKIIFNKDTIWFDGTSVINTSKKLKFVIDEENKMFKVKDDVLTGYDYFFAILPTYSKSTYTVPKNINHLGIGCTSIATSLKEIIIDSDHVVLEQYAFTFCDYPEKITIKNFNSSKITTNTFSQMSGLKEFSCSVYVSEIGYSSFKNDYKLETVTFPFPISIIRQHAFRNCYSLKTFSCPSVTSLLESCFNNCYKLKDVSFLNTTTTIESYTFANTGIVSLTIPDTCYQIGDHAFYNTTSLESVTIGKKVIRICEYAFGNSYVESISIPNNVKYIDSSAFKNSTKLKITIESSNPYFEIKSQALYSKITKTLICTIGALPELYEIPDGIKNIQDQTLNNNMYVIETPTGSFYEGISAARLIIPSSVQSIDITSLKKVFAACYSGDYYLFNGTANYSYAGDNYHYADMFETDVRQGNCTDEELTDDFKWVASNGAKRSSNIGLIIALVLLVLIFIALVIVYLFLPLENICHKSDGDRSVQNESINIV